jgi:exonuclease III
MPEQVLTFLSWNVDGRLMSFEGNETMQHIFHDVHVLGVSHTGLQVFDRIPVIKGFTCLSAKPRSYKAKHGGVAVYVRDGVDANVVKEMPEFGMVWVRVLSVFVCVCYIPHSESSYLLRVAI